MNKRKKKLKPLADRKADEYSKYWKAKVKEVFYEYVDIIQPHECIIGFHMGEQCKGNIERHHLIRRNHKAFEFDPNNIVKLCSLHHKYSTRCSAHKAPLEFSYFLQKNYSDKYVWFENNHNLITQKYERQSYKQLYETFSKMVS